MGQLVVELIEELLSDDLADDEFVGLIVSLCRREEQRAVGELRYQFVAQGLQTGQLHR